MTRTEHAADAAPTLPDNIQQLLNTAADQLLARRYQTALQTYYQAAGVAGAALINTPGNQALIQANNYVIPVGEGDCKTALGDFVGAQKCYHLASTNTAVTAAGVDAVKQLWAKYASMYVAWGDSLYLADDAANAGPVYQNVLILPQSVPATELYSATPIAAGIADAKAVVAQLPALIAALASNPPVLPAGVNVTIARPIVDAYTKLTQLAAGLDFYGFTDTVVPIWTFDYLQQIATQYCQLATTTEQNVINFWDRADQSQLSAVELSQHVVDSQTEVDTANRELSAAQLEAVAYQDGVTAAQDRSQRALQDVQSYQSMQSQEIIYQALAAQAGGGQDGDPDRLNALADQLQSGQTIHGEYATLSAATSLVAARLSQQYEQGSLERNAQDMASMVTQANAELTAAKARVDVAWGNAGIAQLHAYEAQVVLTQFNSDTFTPDVWRTIGDRLYTLYRRYLANAVRAARMMQRAFNFENDCDVAVIRSDYSADEVQGLLAADMLLADVSSFTDQQLTVDRTKLQPIARTLSLAGRHSYQFETQFRTTGTMTFDTTADDFDTAYPGTYGGRIVHAEVALQGLVPTSGVSGTLSSAGLSFYRIPSDQWTDDNPSNMRRRVQPPETLVLSDFDRRSDPTAAAGDSRQTGIFAGAGVIGSWTLDIPPEVNDIDYNSITDVLITFTYQARFDPQLKTKVKALLDQQTGAHTTQFGMPLRWVRADVFFELVSNHAATWTIAASDIPLQHKNTKLTQVGLLVTTSAGHSPSQLNISVTAPGAAAASTATTDTNGLITSAAAGSALTTQLGGPVVGQWTLSIPAANNPPWIVVAASGTEESPSLDLSSIANISLLLEYAYTPRSGA